MQFDNHIIGTVIRNKRIQKGMTQEILSGFAEIAIALDMKPSELVAEFENSITQGK